jgi:hypothetical protein
MFYFVRVGVNKMHNVFPNYSKSGLLLPDLKRRYASRVSVRRVIIFPPRVSFLENAFHLMKLPPNINIGQGEIAENYRD